MLQTKKLELLATPATAPNSRPYLDNPVQLCMWRAFSMQRGIINLLNPKHTDRWMDGWMERSIDSSFFQVASPSLLFTLGPASPQKRQLHSCILAVGQCLPIVASSKSRAWFAKCLACTSQEACANVKPKVASSKSCGWFA